MRLEKKKMLDLLPEQNCFFEEDQFETCVQLVVLTILRKN